MQTTAPGCLTPEAVTPARPPLPAKRSSLIDTAAWATHGALSVPGRAGLRPQAGFTARTGELLRPTPGSMDDRDPHRLRWSSRWPAGVMIKLLR